MSGVRGMEFVTGNRLRQHQVPVAEVVLAGWRRSPSGDLVCAYRAPDGEVVQIRARSREQSTAHAIEVLNARRMQREERLARREPVGVQVEVCW